MPSEVLINWVFFIIRNYFFFSAEEVEEEGGENLIQGYMHFVVCSEIYNCMHSIDTNEK